MSERNQLSHQGKTALVTGASRGIGRGIAVRLGELGFGVVVNYVSNHEAAARTCDQIQSTDGAAWSFQADVADGPGRSQLVEFAESKTGKIDLLVNNVGVPVADRVDLLEATEASWDRVMGINLKGPYFLSQLAAHSMVRHLPEYDSDALPQLINISSVSAYASSPNRGEYCVAKAGMMMMTQLFAERLAEHEIGVYELRPGVIKTDMTHPVKEKYDQLIADGMTPIRRWGEPKDVALAVEAIVSRLFPFSTGEVINIDGGFHIRRL